MLLLEVERLSAIYLVKSGKAEKKTTFNWGIPLHWWLKSPCFGSQHLLALAVFSASPAMWDSRGLTHTLEQDSMFSPVCRNTKQPFQVCTKPSQRRLLPKHWCGCWGRMAAYHLLHVRFHLQHVIAGFAVRIEDTPSRANTSAWHLMVVSQDCASYLLWKTPALRATLGSSL